MHRFSSTTFVVLLVVATSGCALLSPSKEALEKADYGPPPEDYIEKIARYFERRYGDLNLTNSLEPVHDETRRPTDVFSSGNSWEKVFADDTDNDS